MFSYQSDGSASNALIFSTGSIIFVPETGQEFICSDVNLDDFWGEQECFFKFGSWTYDGNLLNIVPYDNKTELDLGEYDKSSPLLVRSLTHLFKGNACFASHASFDFQIKNTSIEKFVKYYPCCDEPYPYLLMTLTVQRKYIIQDNGIVVHNPNLQSQNDECV